MAYLTLYITAIAFIWWIFHVGWSEAIKTILSVLIPSLLIILFNACLGRILFRNPVVGIITALPTSFFIYKRSQTLVSIISRWIGMKGINIVESQVEIVETEVISKEDA